MDFLIQAVGAAGLASMLVLVLHWHTGETVQAENTEQITLTYVRNSVLGNGIWHATRQGSKLRGLGNSAHDAFLDLIAKEALAHVEKERNHENDSDVLGGSVSPSSVHTARSAFRRTGA